MIWHKRGLKVRNLLMNMARKSNGSSMKERQFYRLTDKREVKLVGWANKKSTI
jgi:hypothetical protein